MLPYKCLLCCQLPYQQSVPPAMAGVGEPGAAEPAVPMEPRVPTGPDVPADAAPSSGAMSTRRLRSEDYNDYSSTDVTPEGSPPAGINGFARPESYQRFGESNGTT